MKSSSKKYLITLCLILIIIKENLAFSKGNRKHQNDSLQQIEYTKCVINNHKYPNDYLYTSNQLDKKTNVELHQLDELDEFDQIIWKLIPIGEHQSNTSDNLVSTFYLKSELFDYYLCASDKFQQVITSRYKFHSTRQRMVQVKKKPTHLTSSSSSSSKMDKCKWTFEKVNSTKASLFKNSYMIKNWLHNEMLYAGSNSQKASKYKRNVYLWPNAPLHSDQFKWYVVCSPGSIFN